MPLDGCLAEPVLAGVTNRARKLRPSVLRRQRLLGSCPEIGHDKGDPKMAGKFELYTDKAGKYRFRLKAGNGEIIASSEAYESKASAKNGIESVRKNAPDAPVVEQD
jgi:uncharacterized protein